MTGTVTETRSWITAAIRGRERAEAETAGKPAGLTPEQAVRLACDRLAAREAAGQ